MLLLDEPAASLDRQSAALVEELIRYQTLAGRSVILVSHDEGQVDRLAHARLQLARHGAAPDAAGQPEGALHERHRAVRHRSCARRAS